MVNKPASGSWLNGEVLRPVEKGNQHPHEACQQMDARSALLEDDCVDFGIGTTQ